MLKIFYFDIFLFCFRKMGWWWKCGLKKFVYFCINGIDDFFEVFLVFWKMVIVYVDDQQFFVIVSGNLCFVVFV